MKEYQAVMLRLTLTRAMTRSAHGSAQRAESERVGAGVVAAERRAGGRNGSRRLSARDCLER